LSSIDHFEVMSHSESANQDSKYIRIPCSLDGGIPSHQKFLGLIVLLEP